MIPFLFAFSNCCIIEIHISLFTFSPSALHYISNSHSLSHLYIRSYLLLLLLLLSPHNPFTFLPFYFFTFKRPFTFKTTSRRSACCIATQSFVRPDVAIATSWRSFGRIGREVKNIRMQAAIPRDALSDSSNIFLSYTGLLIFCPCVRQQYKM